MKRLSAVCLAVLFAGFSVAPAAATGLTVYTSRTAYLAAIHSVAVDSYDDLGATTDDLPDTLVRSVGDYFYTVSAAQGLPGDFLYRAGTAENVSISTFNTPGFLFFSGFSGGANAVGGDFYATSADGSYAPSFSIVVAVLSIGDAHPNLNDWQMFTIDSSSPSTFLGFVWDRTTSPWPSLVPDVPYFFVGLNDQNGVTWPTVDNLTLGIANAPAVPEPASWALMLGGFALLGDAMRRRKPAFKLT